MTFNYFENKLQKIKADFLKIGFIFLLFCSFSGYSQPKCMQSFFHRTQKAVQEIKDRTLNSITNYLHPESVGKPAGQNFSADEMSNGTNFFVSPNPFDHKFLQVHENVKKSIWQIYSSRGSGTGFFISPNHFITNFHVIKGLLQNMKISDISLKHESFFQTLKVQKILNLSAKYDLALLEVSPYVPSYSQLILRSYPITTQETVWVSGYPGGQFKNATGTGVITSETFFDFDEIFVNLLKPSNSLFGFSGSPVFDLLGQVVGVFSIVVVNKNKSTSIFSLRLDNLQKFVKEGAVLNCRDFSCIEEELNNLKRRGLPTIIEQTRMLKRLL